VNCQNLYDFLSYIDNNNDSIIAYSEMVAIAQDDE